jgi:hypothetical protein
VACPTGPVWAPDRGSNLARAQGLAAGPGARPRGLGGSGREQQPESGCGVEHHDHE